MLGAHNGHPRVITGAALIDMSPADIAGGWENLGEQAVVGFDPFHVIMRVNFGVAKLVGLSVRKPRARPANSANRLAEFRSSNPESPTAKQAARFVGLLKSKLARVKADQLRVILRRIFEIADPRRARSKLRAGCRGVGWVAGKPVRALCAAMVKTAKVIERHLEGVLEHRLHRTTNALREGPQQRLLRRQA